MDKDQIIQLRNHHLKQGRNNDRRPIYPITKAECIIGDVGGGVEKVDTLPETGEAGKIYYNTSDGKYYAYDKKEFTSIGSGIETVTTFGVASNGMPSVDTQLPIPSDEVRNILPALYYQYTNDNIKLWIVRISQQDENYAIIHPLGVNPDTIFYNSIHHYYFKIAPVPYVASYNKSNRKAVIAYKYKPIVVCTEQTIIPSTECTFNDTQHGEVVGLLILSPSCFCEMGMVDYVEFVEIGPILYREEPLLKAQVISGKFVANKDNVRIMLPTNSIHFAGGNPKIKENHIYEYSIFDGVFNLIDITIEGI